MSESEDRLQRAYAPPRKDSSEGNAIRPANELAYFPEGERASSSVTAMWGVLTPVFAFAGVAAISQSVAVGAAAGTAMLGYGWLRKRQQRTVPRAVLKVEGERLYLSGPAFGNNGPHSTVITLDALLDVYLDTKTIQRVQENAGPIPDLRFINATVGGEQDTARIGLELENETFFLTEQRVSHTDANEWFGKIRRFLRQHGWVPEDERAA